MARDPNHAVWDVYDLYRTARLNVKYYGCRVSALDRQNFWVEIVLAATASGSAIAGLAFWNTGPGKSVWQVLIVVSAVLAVAKPLLKYTERIQRLEELIADYRVVEHDLKKIEVAVRQRRSYDQKLHERFIVVMERMNDLVQKKGEYNVNEELRARCEKEVARELPSTHFFVPEEAP